MSLIRKDDGNVVLPAGIAGNMLYFEGKAKSKTWTIGTYTGTGVAGNFVETRDSEGVARRPRRVIIKRTDSTGNWILLDSERDQETQQLVLNLSVAENDYSYDISIGINGFTLTNTNIEVNTSGGTYLYLVEFDTDGTGTTGSYFDNPTNTTQLQLADGVVSISNAYSDTGAINVVVIKSGTISPTNGWL